MFPKIVIGLLVVGSFLGCRKEYNPKPYGYLHLRVGGQEEDVKWETLSAEWADSLGKAELKASSYYFDHCTIRLKNITRPGVVNPLTILQFYYSDGLDFWPSGVRGTLIVTEASEKAIRGTFDVYFETNNNSATGKRVKGSFGIVNAP